MEESETKARKSLAQMQLEASQNGGGGFGCPQCGCCDLRVANVWVSQGVRKRLRKCRNCGTPVNTVEKFEE